MKQFTRKSLARNDLNYINKLMDIVFSVLEDQQEQTPLTPSESAEYERLSSLKTPYLQYTMWVCIATNSLMILYSFFLMKRMLSFMKWTKQKVMLQTILYISLSMIFRLYQQCTYQYMYLTNDWRLKDLPIAMKKVSPAVAVFTNVF